MIRENSGIRVARRAASVGVARIVGQGQSRPQASQVHRGPSAVCATGGPHRDRQRDSGTTFGARPGPRYGGCGDCVEVADNLAGVIGVRDSKDPVGPTLAFDPAAWTRFLVLAKRG